MLCLVQYKLCIEEIEMSSGAIQAGAELSIEAIEMSILLCPVQYKLGMNSAFRQY